MKKDRVRQLWRECRRPKHNLLISLLTDEELLEDLARLREGKEPLHDARAMSRYVPSRDPSPLEAQLNAMTDAELMAILDKARETGPDLIVPIKTPRRGDGKSRRK